MRRSENFGLILCEGTDIFNPLTTDVPNYEKIDAQMEKNYNLSVGKATELKTGTVHALTRENADCPMIHFTATSNFTSNDTFTVDGIQVSALLVDGSTLPTNCYIIGSEVICYLKGTLLTFFLSGSVSKDSEKLGGELPSYYAKQEDITQLETTINSTGEIVKKNSTDIVKIKNSLRYEKTPQICGTFNGSNMYRQVVEIGNVSPGMHEQSYTLAGTMKDFCGAKILYHRVDGKRQQAPSNVSGMNNGFELDVFDFTSTTFSYYIGELFTNNMAISGGSLVIEYTIV